MDDADWLTLFEQHVQITRHIVDAVTAAAAASPALRALEFRLAQQRQALSPPPPEPEPEPPSSEQPEPEPEHYDNTETQQA